MLAIIFSACSWRSVRVFLPLAAASVVRSRPKTRAQPAVARRIGAIKAISGTCHHADAGFRSGSHGDGAAQRAPSAHRARRKKSQERDSAPVAGSASRRPHSGRAARPPTTANRSPPEDHRHRALRPRSASASRMRQDWQKRGIGGLVSAVDPAAGTVTISSPVWREKSRLLCTPRRTR